MVYPSRTTTTTSVTTTTTTVFFTTITTSPSCHAISCLWVEYHVMTSHAGQLIA